MSLAKFATISAWIAVAVGILRFLLGAPLMFGQLWQVVNLMSEAGAAAAAYQLLRLVLDTLFYCIQSVLLGIILLLIVRMMSRPSILNDFSPATEG